MSSLPSRGRMPKAGKDPTKHTKAMTVVRIYFACLAGDLEHNRRANNPQARDVVLIGISHKSVKPGVNEVEPLAHCVFFDFELTRVAPANVTLISDSQLSV
jgi:hypothetical protein